MSRIKRKHALCFLGILIAFPFCHREDLLPFLKKEPISISITPSPAIQRINNTIQFRADALFSSGTIEDVTDKTQWSVSGNAEANSTPGSFTTAATEGTATINASYTTLTTGTVLTASAILNVTDDIFVSPAGNDSGTGAPTDPFLTIEHALTVATSAGMNIRIAEGDYYPASQIQLTTDGVSLLGGYTSDWVRDVVNHRARIFDISTTGPSLKGAILCDTGITSATSLEGLEIYGSTVFANDWSSGILAYGNPRINNCRVAGGKGALFSCGVYLIITGDIIIEYSNIDGGTGPDESYGIYKATASAGGLTIRNTNISGGFGSSDSYGIRTEEQSAVITIRNSNINGGAGTTFSYGLYISETPDSLIEYSNIDGGSSANSCGIQQPSIASAKLTIRGSGISGGTGLTQNTGIFLQNTSDPSPFIYNNIITCGLNLAGTGSVACIKVAEGSQPIIANNTISTGNVINTAFGITTNQDAHPYIYNNLLIIDSGTTRYGISEGFTNSDPAEVRNNIFHNATILYSNFNLALPDNWTTIIDMENGLNADGTIASGNILINPQIAGNGDFHLTAFSPVEARTGGLNGMDEGWSNFPMDITTTYPVDRDGNARAVAGSPGDPWSIGAYEYVP